jgi:hypothetical protein
VGDGRGHRDRRVRPTARWIRRLLLDSAGLPAPDEPQETLDTLATPEGAREANDAIDALAHDAEARKRLYPRVREMLDGSGQTLGPWSPVMVGGEHVEGLNEFVALTGRVWKLAEEWMGAPEWFRPTHERETAPAG